MQKYIPSVRQYLRDHGPVMKEFLVSLVELESPTKDQAAQKPVFEILRAKFLEMDFQASYYSGTQSGGFLVARPAQREKHQPVQLMIGHCDTVWSSGTLHNMPVVESDGRLKGPGVFDMKAGLTQMVFALQVISELGLPMAVTPVCLINSDEETGSRESTPAIRRLSRIAERAFVLEPPLGLEGKLKTERKGLARFTLTVRGRAAHAGLNPGEGASAILELSHQIQQLFALNDPLRGITVNVGMIEGGVSPNVVAPESRAIVDVRVHTLEDAGWITDRILALKPAMPDTRVEVEGGFGRMPMEKTSRNERLFQKAREIGRHLGISLEEGAAGGGSDANTTSQFTATLDGLGTPGDGAHANHEFIFLDQLVERTELLTFLLLMPSID